MKSIIGKINPNDRHVTIWGAGFSGLVLGFYLKQQGYKITIHERADRVGGKIRTKKTQYGLVETAANALYLNADVLELIRDLKLEPLPASPKLKRLLWVHGKAKRLLQLSALTKVGLNAHKKPPLIAEGLTVAEFFRPLLGDELINNYLSPAFSGIYSIPAESLHFKSVFEEPGQRAQFDSYWEFIRTLIKIRKAQPKLDLRGSVSFEGGMQVLVTRLAEVLKPDIKLNYKEKLKLVKGNNIICTDAHKASELLNDLKPELATELKRVRYQKLSSVTVYLKREIRLLHQAFGVLVPFKNEQNINSIGIVNQKALFPANNPNVFCYTLIAPKKLTEDEVNHDLKVLYPDFVPEDVELMEETYWENAIPMYDLHRYLAVKKLHQLTNAETNLAIFGNYVGGISLRQITSAAKKFATEFSTK